MNAIDRFAVFKQYEAAKKRCEEYEELFKTAIPENVDFRLALQIISITDLYLSAINCRLSDVEKFNEKSWGEVKENLEEEIETMRKIVAYFEEKGESNLSKIVIHCLERLEGATTKLPKTAIK